MFFQNLFSFANPGTVRPIFLCCYKNLMRHAHVSTAEQNTICHICECVLSRVWLFAAPWTVAHQVPLSMEFSRPECWSGLPFPPPGDLPDPGIEPTSLETPPLAADSLPLVPPGKSLKIWYRKPKAQSVFSSVQFSRSVLSDSLWPQELQHARPPCPSPTPRVYSPCIH